MKQHEKIVTCEKLYLLNFFRLRPNRQHQLQFRLVTSCVSTDKILSRYSIEYAPRFKGFRDIILRSETASREFKYKKQVEPSLTTKFQINSTEMNYHHRPQLCCKRGKKIWTEERLSQGPLFTWDKRMHRGKLAIPRRSRMQSLIQEGRVKDIEFSTRHTTGQIANLLSVNMPTLAGVDPTRYFLDDLVNDLNSSRNQLKGLNLIYYWRFTLHKLKELAG